MALASTSYKEQERFPDSRRQDCNVMTECIKRIANHSQLCSLSAELFSQYLASEMGIRDSRKYLRSLDENMMTAGLTSLLNNRSHFLNRLNTLTRRSLEGLMDRYWAQLLWIKNLQSKVRFLNDENDLYFVFSLSHLSPAFTVFAFGWLLSAVVFLTEVSVD